MACNHPRSMTSQCYWSRISTSQRVGLPGHSRLHTTRLSSFPKAYSQALPQALVPREAALRPRRLKVEVEAFLVVETSSAKVWLNPATSHGFALGTGQSSRSLSTQTKTTANRLWCIRIQAPLPQGVVHPLLQLPVTFHPVLPLQAVQTMMIMNPLNIKM